MESELLNKIVICGLYENKDLEYFRFQEEHSWQTFYFIMALLLYDKDSSESEIIPKDSKDWKNRQVFWMFSSDLIKYHVATDITNKMMSIGKCIRKKADLDWSINYRFVCDTQKNLQKLFYGTSLYFYSSNNVKYGESIVVALLLFLLITPIEQRLSNFESIINDTLRQLDHNLVLHDFKKWIGFWFKEKIMFTDNHISINSISNFLSKDVEFQKIKSSIKRGHEEIDVDDALS